MIYTAHEVMEILRIKQSMVYKLLKEGHIKAFKMGSDWKIPEAALEEYIKKMMEGQHEGS